MKTPHLVTVRQFGPDIISKFIVQVSFHCGCVEQQAKQRRRYYCSVDKIVSKEKPAKAKNIPGWTVVSLNETPKSHAG
jgi:hypothetical protein